jgi:hypothetical protein
LKGLMIAVTSFIRWSLLGWARPDGRALFQLRWLLSG